VTEDKEEDKMGEFRYLDLREEEMQIGDIIFSRDAKRVFLISGIARMDNGMRNGLFIRFLDFPEREHLLPLRHFRGERRLVMRFLP